MMTINRRKGERPGAGPHVLAVVDSRQGRLSLRRCHGDGSLAEDAWPMS
jgi:hypothetical protein